MELFTPEYYSLFRCIASACPDSCCKEWEVDVDEAAAAYYRALPGSLGERLRSVLRDTEDGTVMTIENGRCPMWRQDGLCEIQSQLGHDALCATCRDFPRLRHDYGDFIEFGLELSCPEAARLILTSPAQNMICQVVSGGEEPDYDTEAMEVLRHSREQALAILANDSFTVPQALAILLLYAHGVQSELDGGETSAFDPEECLRQAAKYAQPGDPAALFHFFTQLEILTPQWQTRLSAGPSPNPWTDTFRPLARYFVNRYWLQAVSDYDLICRVKFTIAACLLVHAMGGDPVQTAQLFSKEIENAPDNVDAILDAAYTEPAFTDTHLLGLLLFEKFF